MRRTISVKAFKVPSSKIARMARMHARLQSKIPYGFGFDLLSGGVDESVHTVIHLSKSYSGWRE